MDIERLEQQLSFLREIDKVKSIMRNTLLLDGSRVENDAEHSWHMAICAVMFTEYLDESLADTARMLKMILLHDVIEIYAGDTYAYASPNLLAGQAEREQKAADRLFSLLPADQAAEFRSLWDEFEARITPEARCARMADTFMPLYHNYMTQGKKWRELGATYDRVMKRCEMIRPASEQLYQFAKGFVDESVEKGYLPV